MCVRARTQILACVDELSRMLDVDEPWSLVVRDPSGTSMLGNMADVEVAHPMDKID